MNSEIQLKINDKIANAYLANGGGNGILLLHAWWGLKPFFKQVCDQIAAQGFTVLAPDLYQGRVAASIDEAKALMEKRDDELMGDTVKAAVDYLNSLNPGKPVAVIGFSMGAAWALIVAENEPNVAAAVMFYGAAEADYGKVKAKILAHFAENDEWEPVEYIHKMQREMKTAGLEVTLHFYPGVGHWFVEADRPEYNPAAADLAWKRTVAFLKKNLA